VLVCDLNIVEYLRFTDPVRSELATFSVKMKVQETLKANVSFANTLKTFIRNNKSCIIDFYAIKASRTCRLWRNSGIHCDDHRHAGASKHCDDRNVEREALHQQVLHNLCQQ